MGVKEGMAHPEVHQKSVADNASASGERVDIKIAEEATSPVTESNMNVRWIKEVEEKCESALKGLLRQSELPDDKRDPKIPKSTPSEEEFSQPRAVTIGPFHRDKSTHITDKEKYLIVYLMNHLYDLVLKDRLIMIKNQVANARSRYSDSDIPESFGSTNDNRFAEMLLLDSYFILFMLTFSEIHSKVTCEGVNLYRHYSSKSLKILPGKLFRADSSKKQKIMLGLHAVPRFANILHHKDLIMVDLLILQNQIPFFVIEKLFKKLKLKKPLHKYALKFFKTIHPRSTQGCKCQKRPAEFSHLLHLFHWSRVPEKKDNVPRSWRPQLDDVYWECYIPTATKLRKYTTLFKRRHQAINSLDIKFWRGRPIPIMGVLIIPRLHIHEYSGHVFRNLIAFERQYPRSDRRIMAFSAIMQNLVQTEEDVKLLRRCGILANTCMADSKIINFFKSLSRTTKNDDMPIDVYVFCRQVLSYHKRRISRFYANAILKCFPNC